MTNVVGRKKEMEYFRDIYESGRPAFVALYGRRRVGKTFLVNEMLGDELAFKVTGVANAKMAEQLENFNIALNKKSEHSYPKARNWLEAFSQLEDLLEQNVDGKRQVVFIDELPWLDTQKSKFLSGLEHFWNNWGSARRDVLLIVCGSATSWVVNKLINNKGGLYNRITRSIKLEPYSLSECEDYFAFNNIVMSKYQMLEAYMIFGGIPYYLSLLDKKESLVQNVNRLCFASGGELKNEFDRLYASLFVNSERYIKVVQALSKKAMGMTRTEIIEHSGLPSGGNTAAVLDDLELSGFIRKYHAFNKKNKGAIYQLVDFFSLFHLKYMIGKNTDDKTFWLKYNNSPEHNVWRGYAYEKVCLIHTDRIKEALGISGIGTSVSSWRSNESANGAQIDLVIDRADGVINLCEIKYSNDEFVIDKRYDEILRHKMNTFRNETKTKKALHQTMITTYGLKDNAYARGIQWQLTFEDLFG